MTIHVFVEGSSERALFEYWLPRILRDQYFRVHPHQGKGSLQGNLNDPPQVKARGLLDQLPAKLRAFSSTLNPEEDGVLILLDADDDDPAELKKRIEEVVEGCAPNIKVRVSVAVEETEAFYLGDLRALRRAYPTADLSKARDYVPDSICGTWELFGQIIDDDGGNKVAWAEAMGPHLTTQPAQTRSPSFRGLIQHVNALVPGPVAAPHARPYRHKSKTEKREGRRR